MVSMQKEVLSKMLWISKRHYSCFLKDNSHEQFLNTCSTGTHQDHIQSSQFSLSKSPSTISQTDFKFPSFNL